MIYLYVRSVDKLHNDQEECWHLHGIWAQQFQRQSFVLHNILSVTTTEKQ